MILGIKKNGKKPWFNKACEDSVKRRKVIRKYWLKDINNEARAREFSRRKKETHSIIRVKKRKYLLRIIEDADRIKKKAEQRMGDYQGGFRAGRSMTDQMFMFLHKPVNLISISIMETLARVRVGNTLADPITQSHLFIADFV
ncbi:hypothetical protein QTP88_022265 [Uroleucon formosanum]